MQLLKDQFSNQEISHHFQIVEGTVSETISYLKKELKKKLNFDFQNNSNYQEFIFSNLLVDDVRDIIKSASLKIKDHTKAVYVIGCETINIQAQNALLKLAEESHHNKIIFLIIPDANNLLPTLKSRAVISKNISNEKSDPYYFLDSINSFTDLEKCTPKERIELVNSILNRYEKEEITKDDIRKIISDILNNLRVQLAVDPKLNADKIEKINQANFYINQNGASVKNLLEFIFLSF